MKPARSHDDGPARAASSWYRRRDGGRPAPSAGPGPRPCRLRAAPCGRRASTPRGDLRGSRHARRGRRAVGLEPATAGRRAGRAWPAGLESVEDAEGGGAGRRHGACHCRPGLCECRPSGAAAHGTRGGWPPPRGRGRPVPLRDAAAGRYGVGARTEESLCPGRRGFVERDAGLVCAPRPSHGRRAGLSSPARSAGEPQRQTRVEGVPLRSPPRGQTSGRRPRRLVAGGERASGLHEGAQRLGARAQRLLAEPARRLPGLGCPRSLKRRALGWLGAWARERRGPARGTPASETSAPAGAFLASGREPVAAPLKGPVSAEPARLAIHPL